MRKRQPKGCQHTYEDVKILVKDFRDFLAVDLRLENRTLKIHCNNLNRFLKAVKKNPFEISKLDVRSYLHERMKLRSRSTVNNDLKTLKRFFRDYLDTPEVVNSFRFPQSPFKPKVILSNKELRRAYQTIDSDLGRALFLFYATTGLRRNEVLSLTAKEVDFKKRMVMPRCHGGKSKISYVSFYNEETEQSLEKVEKKNERVFLISDRQFRNIWKNIKEKTGLDVKPQRLREWFCCEMGKLGVPDRYIDAFCGRVPRSVLARHYTAYSPEELKEIYDKANLKVLT